MAISSDNTNVSICARYNFFGDSFTIFLAESCTDSPIDSYIIPSFCASLFEVSITIAVVLYCPSSVISIPIALTIAKSVTSLKLFNPSKAITIIKSAIIYFLI